MALNTISLNLKPAPGSSDLKSSEINKDAKIYVVIGKSYLTGQWFSLGPTVSSTNKTNRHDIAEILLKVALNTIKPNQTFKAGLTVLYIDR